MKTLIKKLTRKALSTIAAVVALGTMTGLIALVVGLSPMATLAVSAAVVSVTMSSDDEK